MLKKKFRDQFKTWIKVYENILYFFFTTLVNISFFNYSFEYFNFYKTRKHSCVYINFKVYMEEPWTNVIGLSSPCTFDHRLAINDKISNHIIFFIVQNGFVVLFWLWKNIKHICLVVEKTIHFKDGSWLSWSA